MNNRDYLQSLASVAADLQTLGYMGWAEDVYGIQTLLEKEYERKNLMGYSKEVTPKKKKTVKRLSRYDIAKL